MASAATGTITVTEGGTTVATGTVSSGGAVMTTGALTAGSHSYIATYSGDGSYLGSSSSTLSVTAKTTTTGLTLAVTAGAVPTSGQTLSLTASGLASAATGTITVTEGGTTVASGTVSSGGAVMTTGALTAGSHSYIATYSGDGSYLGSSSSTLSVTAKTTTTGLTLAVTAGAVPTSGQTLSLTASGLASGATGTITVTEGGTMVASGTVSSGGAVMTTGALTAGSHSYIATYSGDGSYQSSTATLTVIAKISTSISVTFSSTTITFGSPITVKATVVATGAVSSSSPALSGNVIFYDNGKTINTLSLNSNGTVSFNSTAFSVGTHEISATYVGNAYYLSSTVDPQFNVVHTDPTLNADVQGIFAAQVAATQHIVQVTQSTVNGRLEALHDDDVPEFANGLSFSNSANGRQMDQPDSCLGLNQNDNDIFLDKITGLYKNTTRPTSQSQAMAKQLIRPDYNIWTAGSIVFGNQSYTGQTTHNTFSMSGVTVGIDRRFTSQFKGGLAVGLSAETTNVNTTGAYNKTRAATGSLYGSYNLGNSLFIDGQIGYGAARFTTSRTDTNANSLMSGKRPGQLMIGSFTLSSEQKAGKLRYAPYARVDFMKAVLNAYQEQGDADWTLAYNKMNISSTALVLGLRGQYDFAMDFGTLSPTLRAEYNYNLSGSAVQNLSYVSDSTSTYALTQSASSRSGMTMAAGLKASGSHQLSGSIEYVVTTTGAKVQGQTVRAAVNHAF